MEYLVTSLVGYSTSTKGELTGLSAAVAVLQN